MHAPFASTVARDSIRDCDANEKLRDALGELAAEAMTDVRTRGLLDMSLFAVLPNKEDGLSAFYEPIRGALIKAFQNEDLLPTKSGSHLSAGVLYRGPVEISSVIDDDDLSVLTDFAPPLWAANAPQKGQREDKFLDSLGIDEWGWESLKEAITKAIDDETYKQELEGWLATKLDAWLLRFYALMERCHEETHTFYDPSPLSRAWKSLAGVRVTDGKEIVSHVSPRDAYLPPPSEHKAGGKPVEAPAKVLLVKPEVYENRRFGDSMRKAARDFLKRVGVREYDERTEVERRLESYATPGTKIAWETHYRDLRAFIAFLKKNPTDSKLFQGVAFLVTIDEKLNQLHWTKPEDVFLDAPYENTGLNELIAIHRRRKVWPSYPDHLGKSVKHEDFISFLRAVDVFSELAVIQIDCWHNSQINRSFGRSTHTGRNIDWTVKDLVSYLGAKNHSASRLVWMSLIKADKKVATAEFRPNQTYEIQKAESLLVQHLKSCAWIPSLDGVFRKPQDMTREMLLTAFPFDARNGLLTAIGFEEKANEATEEFKARDAEAKKLGFESIKDIAEALDLLKAKREGRIREVFEIGTTGQNGSGSETQADSASTTGGGIAPPNMPNTSDGDANLSRVLRRINDRVRHSETASVPTQTEAASQESLEDDDDYTPAPVNYSRRIARAEERSANEIARLQHELELQTKSDGLPRYSYGWFLALLELECLSSSEKNADSKTLSIAFNKAEKDPVAAKTIILKEPNRFIPPSVEEFSGVRVDLEFADGLTGKLHVESFTAKEFALLGKLASADELTGIDLSQVVQARIEVQNPSFLLQELLNRFRELGFDENFDMKAHLPPNIEFVFGPPGTGKTTHLAEKVLIPLMNGEESLKALVLTPTNKAADVLTTRIMDKMGPDTSYQDWLVRFGTCADSQIEAAGVWRDRSFNIDGLDRSVTVTTIARYAYDGFATEHGKLHEIEWDVIIVDEASMIPLVNIIHPLYQQKPRKFIVAGDPFQIEPVVAVEQWKGENIYSMVGLDKPGSFAQPVTEPHPFLVTNLETQYRSLPSIGEVFSHFTYNGVLKHHRSATSQRSLMIDGMEVSPLSLIKFPVSKYESIYRAKRLSSGTPYQTYSALFTFEFVRWLAGQIQKNHAGEPPFRIGIIAPYRAQANLLSKLNDSRAAAPGCVEIQVGTVHGFQGDECDIIIAVLNPPPHISTDGRMFLNKQNILNVAISRARDYLFIVMPDRQTQNIENLRKVAKIEALVKSGGAFSEYRSHDVEEAILGNARYLEDNTFSTGHQMVNVYLKPERYYEVRSDDLAIDIQIHEKS